MVTLLLFLPPAGAEPPESFGNNASLRGDIVVRAVGVALIASDTMGMAATFQLDGSAIGLNATQVRLEAAVAPAPRYNWTATLPQETDWQGEDLVANLRAESGLSALRVGPGQLSVHADALVEVRALHGTHCLSELWFAEHLAALPPALNECAADWVGLRIKPAANGTPMELSFHEVDGVAWHNQAVSCLDMDCPDGARPSTVQEARFAGATHQRTDVPALLLHGGEGSLHGQAKGNWTAIYLVGRSIDLFVTGWIRLPSYQGALSPWNPAHHDAPTLQLQGKVAARDVHVAAGGGMAAHLDPGSAATRLDERITVHDATRIATATALVALLWKVAAFLLSMQTHRNPLSLPRRRRVFEALRKNPGASFRELVRSLDMAAGTVRHHLRVLKGAELVIERNYGNTLRFFENRPDYAGSWEAMILLREPGLSELYEWLQEHPGADQTSILTWAARRHGWSRSTLQARLKRLIDGKLVFRAANGRYRRYTARHDPIVALAKEHGPGTTTER